MGLSLLLTAQGLAILTALAFASADAAARSGMRTSTPITVILMLAVVALLVFGPVALATVRVGELDARGLLVLFAAGVLAPGLAGTFFYMSVLRIGLSRTSSIAAASPLVTVLIAVAAVGERPGPLVYMGTLLIVAGVWVLSHERRSSASGQAGGKIVWRDFNFATLTTLLFGVSAALRKVGVSLVPALSAGLCASALGTLVVIALWHPFLPPGERIRLGRQNLGAFVASGAFNSLAYLAFFAALQRGPVSVVAPLAYMTPLFVLVYAWVLFQELERVNARVIIASLLICAGAALVTLSRG